MNQHSVKAQAHTPPNLLPDDVPCCLLPLLTDQPEIYPTSRSIADISDFTSGLYSPLKEMEQKVSAILQQIFARIDVAAYISLEQLKGLALYFNDLLFEGKLFARCDLVLAAPGTMNPNLRGFTVVTSRCYTHQQVHRVKIVINPDDPFPSYGVPRFLDAIETLLHELCRAFLIIFVDRRSLSPMDGIVYCGIEGHGTLFTKLFRAVASRMARSQCLGIDPESHLCFSVSQDAQKLAQALRMWRQISHCSRAGPGRNHIRLGQVLGLTYFKERMMLRQLVSERRDVVEIILIMKYGVWKGDWNHSASRNPYSDPSEPLNMGDIAAYEHSISVLSCPPAQATKRKAVPQVPQVATQTKRRKKTP